MNLEHAISYAPGGFGGEVLATGGFHGDVAAKIFVHSSLLNHRACSKCLRLAVSKHALDELKLRDRLAELRAPCLIPQAFVDKAITHAGSDGGHMDARVVQRFRDRRHQTTAIPSSGPLILIKSRSCVSEVDRQPIPLAERLRRQPRHWRPADASRSAKHLASEPVPLLPHLRISMNGIKIAVTDIFLTIGISRLSVEVLRVPELLFVQGRTPCSRKQTPLARVLFNL